MHDQTEGGDRAEDDDADPMPLPREPRRSEPSGDGQATSEALTGYATVSVTAPVTQRRLGGTMPWLIVPSKSVAACSESVASRTA